MKTLNDKHPSASGPLFEHHWGHPILDFARFLTGTGFWISHAVIVLSVAGVLLMMWFDTTINSTVGTLAILTFGVALLFAFAGWIARCSR